MLGAVIAEDLKALRVRELSCEGSVIIGGTSLLADAFEIVFLNASDLGGHVKRIEGEAAKHLSGKGAMIFSETSWYILIQGPKFRTQSETTKFRPLFLC